MLCFWLIIVSNFEILNLKYLEYNGLLCDFYKYIRWKFNMIKLNVIYYMFFLSWNYIFDFNDFNGCLVIDCIEEMM